MSDKRIQYLQAELKELTAERDYWEKTVEEIKEELLLKSATLSLTNDKIVNHNQLIARVKSQLRSLTGEEPLSVGDPYEKTS